MSYNFEEISSKIQELIINNSSVKSIGLGYKQVNGQQTDELSIVYSVPEKKPLSELSENEIIPSEISLSQGPIKTDVIVIQDIKAYPCAGYCGQLAGPNSSINRSLVRPLIGGLSITATNTISSVGTMGFIAVDTATQALVGVTNNHVSIADAFYTSQRNLAGVIENDHIATNIIYQDGEFNRSFPPPSGNIIGRSLRYVPIYQNGSGVNYVDGAIFSVNQSDISNTFSYRQANDGYTSPLPFATTSEINNLLSTNPMIYSSGRTTGPKGGASCPIRVIQLGATVIAGYTRQASPILVPALFSDTIVFVKPENDPSLSTICPWPIAGGDSGSALIADFGGTRKIIGICFAGGEINNIGYYGYACRIDRVAQELGIEAWDGTPKNFVDPSTIEYRTLPGGSSTKVINCDGKDFWQAGLTNLSNNCTP